MPVWNVPHAACWKYRSQKIAKNLPSVHHCTTLSAISLQLRHISTIREKKLVKQQYLLHISSFNMLNYGPLMAEIGLGVWGTPTNFSGFCFLAAFLHGTLHCVSKNVLPLTCYNLDLHNPITIIFGRIVTMKVANQTMLCFPTWPI